MAQEKNERTVIHLFKKGDGNTAENDINEYFGSPASLYDKYSAEELGISLPALNNYFHLSGNACKQTKTGYFIRKGILYVKPTTRGRKKQENFD